MYFLIILKFKSYPNGGCYIVKLKKKTELLDRLWEQLIFATIAEEFEEPDVVGVNVSIRSKEDVLSVWNKDVKNSRAMYAIG